MEILAIRLDAIKKILAVLFYQQDRFKEIEPEIEELICG